MHPIRTLLAALAVLSAFVIGPPAHAGAPVPPSDNRLFANQAVDWLAEIAATVRVEPSAWSDVKMRYRD